MILLLFQSNPKFRLERWWIQLLEQWDIGSAGPLCIFPKSLYKTTDFFVFGSHLKRSEYTFISQEALGA